MRSIAVRPVIATTAIAAVLTLAGCEDTDTDIDHGKVIDKRSRAAQDPVYEQVERPAPCRATRTQTLRSTLAKPRPKPPKPPADTNEDQPDAPQPPRTDTSKKTPPRSTPGARTPDKGAPAAPCGTTTVRVFKGYRTPAKWELKLQDGKETDWETVSREEYDSVDIGDHF
ncbi:hypothetical protein ACFFSH_28785 [Streptomyces filamentosus]|uniref:Lipoprotein n=1 Tax=Streptomyces filamentosus TaxID=67294 RepID=A0A919ER90_STRFL|nr:hypothetical protein [Streptomyces filamentosus]GHG22900.1 hypothetical protein GCM10017667_68670 [Streptomyces filamentosus]